MALHQPHGISQHPQIGCVFKQFVQGNISKANLRDLIAATGPVILLKFDPNHRFFSLCDLKIWRMTSKNIRAPLLYYIKLCASFQIYRWIQTEVTNQKRSIRVKIGNFLSRVTSKFDGWPWKTIGQLFYTTLSFVHHFKAMGVTVRKRSIQVKIGNFFVPCDIEIWWMTLKNNRPPVLCFYKLCATFHSHQWTQTGVTVWKRTIWVKIDNYFSRVTLKFDGWPWKTIGHLIYATPSFVHHFVAISEIKLELQSGNAQFGSKSTFLLAVWPSNLKDDLEK